MKLLIKKLDVNLNLIETLEVTPAKLNDELACWDLQECVYSEDTDTLKFIVVDNQPIIGTVFTTMTNKHTQLPIGTILKITELTTFQEIEEAAYELQVETGRLNENGKVDWLAIYHGADGWTFEV